jgi:hypothetical protein
MIVSVTCKTDRFNLSIVGDDFINDCCFGEDFSNWLVSALSAMGVEADVLCMEDFGWANIADYGDASYLMCVGGNSDMDPGRPNYGEWRVMLERRRTFVQRIMGKNKMTSSDPLFRKIVQILTDESFSDVAIEP